LATAFGNGVWQRRLTTAAKISHNGFFVPAVETKKQTAIFKRNLTTPLDLFNALKTSRPFLFKTRKKIYSIIMDDRKKQIEELEQSRRENQAALDSLLERLGENLLSRAGESGVENTEEYRRLKKEIADSEDSIKTVEEQIRRFRELEERISAKEQEDSAHSKELAGIYSRLGKTLFEENSDVYAVFTGPFREQAEALVVKARSLEDRLAELEQKEGSNVFTWIGKSAQGLVLRSFLTKTQENLEQLYRSAGERYSRDDARLETPAEGPAAFLLDELEQARNRAKSLSEDLVKLREEKRRISENFGAEGSPVKQIQTLKNNIAHVRDNLRILYRRFGAEASSIIGPAPEGVDLSEQARERKGFINALIDDDDRNILNEAARINSAIRDNERTIEKLRASLAIDEEKAKIEKCRRLIEDKRKRIAEAEKDIADFEESIKDSEKYIEELQKIL
jgi:predicted  nucleic acid-binding Zn-ribbon protein